MVAEKLWRRSLSQLASLHLESRAESEECAMPVVTATSLLLGYSRSQKQLKEGTAYVAYSFLSITERGPGRNSRQELKQRPQRNAAHGLALRIRSACYVTQPRTPRLG